MSKKYMLVVFTDNRNKVFTTDSLREALDWWKINSEEKVVSKERGNTKTAIGNNRLIDAGEVLRTSHSIKSFKMFGNYYSTNKQRVKIYSYDDKSWKKVKVNMFWKLQQIFGGHVRKLV